MKKLIDKSIFLCLLIFNTSFAQEQNTIDWQRGPSTYSITSKAQLFVPEDYVFLGTKETDKYLTLTENLGSGEEYFFGPANDSWESYFSFKDLGYVKDDNDIDAKELLEQTIENQKHANSERKKRGWGLLFIEGWAIEPRYDSRNNLLEWAFLLKDEQNQSIINYDTRILGRSGVMNVILVATPETLSSAVADFKQRIRGFEFVSGEKYLEYKKGDRVAEFGLAALITGGAAALATKKGVWAAIVAFFVAFKKLLIVGVLASLAWIGSLFRKKK